MSILISSAHQELNAGSFNSLKRSKIKRRRWRKAPAPIPGIQFSLLSQPQKKKIKKDPTGKKRKQTNSSDEPDSKAAKTDGSDNSDSDNGKGGGASRSPPSLFSVVLCFNAAANLLGVDPCSFSLR